MIVTPDPDLVIQETEKHKPERADQVKREIEAGQCIMVRMQRTRYVWPSGQVSVTKCALNYVADQVRSVQAQDRITMHMCIKRVEACQPYVLVWQLTHHPDPKEQFAELLDIAAQALAYGVCLWVILPHGHPLEGHPLLYRCAVHTVVETLPHDVELLNMLTGGISQHGQVWWRNPE